MLLEYTSPTAAETATVQSPIVALSMNRPTKKTPPWLKDVTPFYQPLVKSKPHPEKGYAVKELEALARIYNAGCWTSLFALLSAKEIKKYAYEFDLVMFEKTCADIKLLRDAGVKNYLKRSVNFTAHTLSQHDLIHRLRRIREAYNVHPQCVPIEVLENKFAKNKKCIIYSNLALLYRERAVCKKDGTIIRPGHELKIDDFLSGYSTKARLKEMKKIVPGGLVVKFSGKILDMQEAKQRSIISTVINHGGRELVFENIEDTADGQRKLASLKTCLKEFPNCSITLQGFFVAKAQHPDKIREKIIEAEKFGNGTVYYQSKFPETEPQLPPPTHIPPYFHPAYA